MAIAAPSVPRSPGAAATPSTPSSALPAPVERWMARVRPELEAPIRTIYLEGPARFKRGRLPYLPMRIRIWTRLGFDRVSELEVRIAGLTLMRGFDAYVDGHGFTQVGGELSSGPSVDQGAFHVMFLETLLVPGAWPPDIRWEWIDDHAARVVAPFAGGYESAVMGFDRATYLPWTYRTERFKGSTAEKVPWTATVSGWRDFGSLLYPSRVEARWADEAKPWLRMRIDRAAIDPPMSEPLARARAMLATVPS